MKKLLLLIFVPLFIGCTPKYSTLPTVSKVDIERYKGRWYEIARFEHFFEKGCKNVTADYTLNDDGTIKVINQCTLIKDNEKKEAVGEAYATDASNAKLKVSFFKPFYGDYYIIDLAEDYSYAVVGNPDRDYLWILARSKSIDKSLKEKIVASLPALKFDPSRLLWTIQE